MGQVSRDVIRLLRADANPGELVWEAVALGAPRADFGWGHSIASATDCLAMVDLYDGDQRALPIVQGIAGIAEVERDRPVNELPDPVAELRPRSGAEFRRLVEAEQLEPAQALVRGAIHAGWSADELRPWFTAVVSDHLLSATATGDLHAEGVPAPRPAGVGARRHGAAAPRADDRLRHREDTLPYMRPFTKALAGVDLDALSAVDPDPSWRDDGRLQARFARRRRPCGPAPRRGRCAARRRGCRRRARRRRRRRVAERMLRYDRPASSTSTTTSAGSTSPTASRTPTPRAGTPPTCAIPTPCARAVVRVPRPLDGAPRVAHHGRSASRGRPRHDRPRRRRRGAAAAGARRHDDGVHRPRPRRQDDPAPQATRRPQPARRDRCRHVSLPGRAEARALRGRHRHPLDRLPLGAVPRHSPHQPGRLWRRRRGCGTDHGRCDDWSWSLGGGARRRTEGRTTARSMRRPTAASGGPARSSWSRLDEAAEDAPTIDLAEPRQYGISLAVDGERASGISSTSAGRGSDASSAPKATRSDSRPRGSPVLGQDRSSAAVRGGIVAAVRRRRSGR